MKKALFGITIVGILAFSPITRSAPPANPTPPGDAVVTRSAVRLDNHTLPYTATAGTLVLTDNAGQPQANVFFVAYTLAPGDKTTRRPLTFAFNGGPGASSAWLHLAALGPKRIAWGPDIIHLPKSYDLTDNEYTWLDFTDLVFIDPVGAGFSRTAPNVSPKGFWGAKGDVESVGSFIRQYLTRYERWRSPLFLAGESYGATRAAALAAHLQTKWNINLNGLFLISPALDFGLFGFSRGNDLACVLNLPAYTAAAWFHRRLPSDLQADLVKTLTAAEQWAFHDYLVALAKGDTLTGSERDRIANQLSRFTGLPVSEIAARNLRIGLYTFTRELLRAQNRRLGYLDSRVTAIVTGEADGYDPALFITEGPLQVTMMEYSRRELKFQTDMTYIILNREANESWDWGVRGQGFLNVTGDLKQAMSRNTHMKVFIAAGYYDLATPYGATVYTVRHLGLDPAIRDHVTTRLYPTGHQMYTNLAVWKQVKADVLDFLKTSE